MTKDKAREIIAEYLERKPPPTYDSIVIYASNKQDMILKEWTYTELLCFINDLEFKNKDIVKKDKGRFLGYKLRMIGNKRNKL